MVVAYDDRRAVAADRLAEQLAVPDQGSVYRSDVDGGDGNNTVLVVEQYHAQLLLSLIHI